MAYQPRSSGVSSVVWAWDCVAGVADPSMRSQTPLIWSHPSPRARRTSSEVSAWSMK